MSAPPRVPVHPLPMLLLLACASSKPTGCSPSDTDPTPAADTADTGAPPHTDDTAELDDTAPDDTADPDDTAPDDTVHRWSGEYEAWRLAHGRVSDVAGLWLAAGDLDGDGIPDVATGRADDDGTGAAWVFHPDAATAADAFATVTGVASLGLAGAIPGDLDGDGLADLVLAGDAGAVVLPGPVTGARTVDDATITLDGGDAFAGFDHDGDGALDLAVGDGAASVVHVLRGPLPARALTRDLDATATVRGATGSWLGATVRNVGDLDGDGADDLAVLAPQGAPAENAQGAAYVFLGPLAGAMDTADAHATVYAPGASLHGGLSAAADLDADGHADLVVGADGAFVFAGPLAPGPLTNADATAVVTVDRAPCGKALDAAADLDRDGRGDLVLGCPTWGRESAARLWYGPLAGTLGDPDATFVDAGLVDRFGSVVTALGDVNDDGVDDVGFSDPDVGGPVVYLFFGGRR